MPTPWIKQRRSKGELAVFTSANGWTQPVEKAIAGFNALNLGVRLTAAGSETGADIVVRAPKGADTYSRYGATAATAGNFNPGGYHGQTSTFTEFDDRKKLHALTFAVIFLPGAVKATADQKEVIALHEFIHAAGLDGGLPNGSKDKQKQDHDTVGIFVALMKESGKGMIEYLAEKGAKPMPPVRIGTQTRCKMQSIWGAEACKD